ncbi:hypothetical protein DVS28_a4736 [Euzebya pacifica]|uniref:Uncharacterized protein n=1 Tax=Euzebya pacifica TaxID=1608957 RepID=A0A346Y4K0_9ACTN|nr:hypothetical protein DVS28_a4736 [Euzebya pacifica]
MGWGTRTPSDPVRDGRLPAVGKAHAARAGQPEPTNPY